MWVYRLVLCFFVSIAFCELQAQEERILQLKGQLKAAEQQNLSAPEIAQIELTLGEYLQEQGLHNEAIKAFQQGLEYLEDRDTLGQVYAALNESSGLSFIEADKFEMAIPYLLRSKRGYTVLQDTRALARVTSLEGIVYEKLGEWEKAIALQRKSLSLFDSIGDRSGVATTQEHLGSIFEDLEEYKAADSLFRLSYEFWRGTQTAREVDILNNLGDVLRKQGFAKASLEYTKKALDKADSLEFTGELESAFKDLSKGYALLGYHDSALVALNRSQDLSEELQLRGNTDQLNALQTLYESRLKEGEIELLTQQNAAQSARLFLTILTSFVLLAGSLLWYSFQLKKKKLEQKQRQYREELLQAQLANKQQAAANLQREVELKASALSRYSLHLAQKNKLLSDLSLQLKNMAERNHLNQPKKLKELSGELSLHLSQENEWDEFQHLFSDIHPDFIKAIHEVALEPLSSSELRLGMLLRLNLTSKEIASILHITPDSVRVARHRFRKKLPLQKEEDLVVYLQLM